MCQFAQSLATRGFSALASWMDGRRVVQIMDGGQEGDADHGWRVMLIMDGGQEEGGADHGWRVVLIMDGGWC